MQGKYMREGGGVGIEVGGGGGVEWVGRNYGRDDWVRSSIEALIQETSIKDSKIENSMESKLCAPIP